MTSPEIIREGLLFADPLPVPLLRRRDVAPPFVGLRILRRPRAARAADRRARAVGDRSSPSAATSSAACCSASAGASRAPARDRSRRSSARASPGASRRRSASSLGILLFGRLQRARARARPRAGGVGHPVAAGGGRQRLGVDRHGDAVDGVVGVAAGVPAHALGLAVVRRVGRAHLDVMATGVAIHGADQKRRAYVPARRGELRRSARRPRRSARRRDRSRPCRPTRRRARSPDPERRVERARLDDQRMDRAAPSCAGRDRSRPARDSGSRRAPTGP